MKKPQLTNKKGTMKIKCIKCNKKHDEENVCLSINDIIENHVPEKTINDFEKNYLKGMSIENAFCILLCAKRIFLLAFFFIVPFLLVVINII